MEITPLMSKYKISISKTEYNLLHFKVLIMTKNIELYQNFIN